MTDKLALVLITFHKSRLELGFGLLLIYALSTGTRLASEQGPFLPIKRATH